MSKEPATLPVPHSAIVEARQFAQLAYTKSRRPDHGEAENEHARRQRRTAVGREQYG
jgi:hypothetical protein